MKFNLAAHWYRSSLTIITAILLPFSWLFGLCVAIRRALYRCRIFKSHRFTVPVIVVGNITVGGTGKTPFVIWLVNTLQAQGYRPGIVSRGVGGKTWLQPHSVRTDDQVENVGDEALLLVRNTQSPLVICKDRVAAVRHLLQHFQCNIVISDDGLQHYRLARDIEIVIVDHIRQHGNQCLLPAGPLRESIARLNQVDFQVMNGGKDENAMTLAPLNLVNLHSSQQIDFSPSKGQTIHAAAGIGHPERFFTQLQQAGFILITHVFPDHYLYQPQDLDFKDNFPILMTEKDAVRCMNFADDRCWYLKITAKIDDKFKERLLLKISSVTQRRETDDYESDLSGCGNGSGCTLRDN